jgi:hypothetical protein
MNLKVANVIAVELAILIGLMSWLVYSRSPSAEPHIAAEMQQSPAEPATVASVPDPRRQRPHNVDYRAHREQAQPVAEEQTAEQAAPTAQEYEQEIASQPYASSGSEDGSVAANSPSYVEADQEPAVVQSDDLTSPQTVAYAQPSQIVVYSQPAQIIVFSNPRRFANRRRLTPRPGALMSPNHQRPDRLRPHTSEDGIVPRGNPNAPSSRPTQGFGPRGHR